MRRPVALALLVAVGALTGCAPAAEPAPSASEAVTGTPVEIACDDLVPASALTGLWSGFTPSDAVEPTAVSTEIAGYQGQVCGWSGPDGADFQIAVAQLDPAIIEALKNEYFTTSAAVPTYGRPPEIEGYYEIANGRGVADAFIGDYWIEASSASFVEPGDPEPLVRAALDALAG
ncbi:hypothetical protein GTU73_07710 [Rathayibacter sp. VKM Ac-2804]|uniref:hypothetical protein n=1 Tax=Rathayibacter sp. VKM Ac-2804 TaxID=2609257 RepID=UPI00132EE52C|nr:hypothetical protein [Rathayibacter sp. VKM Ac-2804]QHF23902.1 hypothetical protein GTU73_07710 [Rathayibacter sp. VKM Ac-2804]